jgi:hypothetical protein
MQGYTHSDFLRAKQLFQKGSGEAVELNFARQDLVRVCDDIQFQRRKGMR